MIKIDFKFKIFIMLNNLSKIYLYIYLSMNKIILYGKIFFKNFNLLPFLFRGRCVCTE
ncbi:hypothetical protein E27107_50077 [Elizabethkingia anophelis]|nr:hypothetical protein E18064_170077 [Elizabethkingia anophelis]CDN79312.1 hypothetical protein E27107_50077 [Elizabethkingia anophelis]